MWRPLKKTRAFALTSLAAAHVHWRVSPAQLKPLSFAVDVVVAAPPVALRVCHIIILMAHNEAILHRVALVGPNVAASERSY
jgi:hypothetical protein